MTRTPEDSLLPLTRSIADGDPVRWDEAAAAHPDLGDGLARLRRLETIVAALRRVSTEAPEAPEDPGSHPAFRWGPLEVHETIGEGAFGTVYRAIEPRLAREVALKLRRTDETPSTPRELLDEARRLARVRHPNVLVVHGADVHDGRVGLWTELVRGETLDERLDREGPCSADDLVEVGLALSRALGAVHAAGLLHGDIKGANVLRASDGRTLLADFGSGSDAHGARAAPGGGSPLFMAPELLEGAPPTAASDIYALGTLLFRQATGRDPVTAETLDELIASHRAQSRTPLSTCRPDLPAAVAAVVERMLPADPGARFATAADVESALLAASVRSAATSSPTGAMPRLHNLPDPVTSFVGRASERRRIAELLETSPLITVHGMGGAGKSRLALEVGRRVLGRFADGVWIVDLAPLLRSEHVAQAVAMTLHAPAGSDVVSRLVDFLSYRSVLIVLDSCEHVIGGCVPLVEEILAGCPGVRLLATSRQPLGVEGEVTCSLSSLELPDPEPDDPAAVARTEAAALFVERGRVVRPELVLNGTTAGAVGEICRRLDGIPLAIELVAAQLGTFSLEQVRAALGARGGVLGVETRATRARHRTLGATIELSYDLLEPRLKMLLRRLSVFRGGWTLDAAERVSAGDDLEASEIVTLLEAAHRRSFVEIGAARAIGSNVRRHRLLEPVREYLSERLTGDERAAVGARHRDFFVAFARRAAPQLEGPDQIAWLDRLEEEHNNLRRALDACEDSTCDPETALHLTGSLGRFFEIKGHWREGLTHIDVALARVPDDRHSVALARSLSVAGSLARFVGELSRARAYYTRCDAVARALEDPQLRASAANGLGIIADKDGDPAAAESHLRDALDQCAEARQREHRAAYLNTLGVIHMRQGAVEEALGCFEEAVAIARETRRIYVLALALDNYAGALFFGPGRKVDAEAAYREALELMRRLGDPRGIATCSNNLGVLLHDRGRLPEALALMEESLRLKYRAGNRLGIAYSLDALASVAAGAGDHERVVALATAAASIRAAVEESFPPQPDVEEWLEAARRALGDERFASCRRAAERRTLREAVELALAHGPAGGGARSGG